MSLLDEVVDLFGKFLRNTREHGLEYTTGRYYGKYMGFVSDTNDPQGQGRVKVTCEIANGRAAEIDKWAHPSAEFAGKDKGFYTPPSVGDSVWVWFDHGDRSQPRYSGAFWGNTGQTKTRDTSFAPAEFRTGEGQVTTRGFKTKAGHGWLFEDDATKGKRFEAWTGEQTTAGAVATKHHRLVMTDKAGEEEIMLSSFAGQKIRLIDKAGSLAIEATTKNGMFAKLLDTPKKAEIGSPLGYKFTIDEPARSITTETADGLYVKLLDALKKIETGGPVGFKITVDELVGRIALETPAGNKIEILEAGSVILIQDVTGNSAQLSPAGINVVSTTLVNVTAAAAVNIAAGAAANITAAGPLAITGAGMALASSGGAPSTQVAGGISTNSFVGFKSEEFLGGLTQVVSGLWQVTSTVISMISPSIALGTGGVKYFLVDQRFLDLYNAHFHLSTAVGIPTSPVLVPAIIGTVTTTATTAN